MAEKEQVLYSMKSDHDSQMSTLKAQIEDMETLFNDRMQ